MVAPGTAEAQGSSPLGMLCSCLDFFTVNIGCVSPQLLRPLRAELGHHQNGAGPHGLVDVPLGSMDRSMDLSSTVQFQVGGLGGPTHLWTVIFQAEPCTKLRLAALLYCLKRCFDLVPFSHVGRTDPDSMGSGEGMEKRLMKMQRANFAK